jgi:hypothetical protein
MLSKKNNVISLLLIAVLGMAAVYQSTTCGQFELANEQEMLKEAGSCEGCTTANCSYNGESCNKYLAPWHKKIALDKTVPACQMGLEGGCKFSGSTLCYTLYFDCSSSKCIDCSIESAYVPTKCEPTE